MSDSAHAAPPTGFFRILIGGSGGSFCRPFPLRGRCLYAASEHKQLAFHLQTLREYKDREWLRKRREVLLREMMRKWSSSAKAL